MRWESVLLGFLALLAISAGVSLWFVADAESFDRNAAVMQVMILAGMFIATAFYAGRTSSLAADTRSLAEQTAAMVSESRLARQDAHRPILDITGSPLPIELIRQGLAKERDEDAVPEYVSCEVRNVGFGPAFAVELFVNYDESSPSNRRVLPAQTLMVGYEIVDWNGPRLADPERTVGSHVSPLRLRVEPFEADAGGRSGVHVEYNDAFGRRFVARKPIAMDESSVFLGPLEVFEKQGKSVE